MSRRAWMAVTMAAGLGLAGGTAPAAAQWTRVNEVPATRLFAVSASSDTLLACADSVVFVSTDGGGTWHGSATVAPGVTSVQVSRMRSGRIYAGTFGQGVFTSDDLGATWHAFNEGLVGGFLDSQLDIGDLAARGDSLYAATLGAGVYVRSLAAGAWTPFGTAFEDNEDPNVNALAHRGPRVFAAFDLPTAAVIEFSPDDATDWQVLDVLPNVLVLGMAMVGDELYAARADGLWRRATDTVSVPGGSAPAAGLAFAVAGAQPVGDDVRFRFAMPVSGEALLEVFDVGGRRVRAPLRQSFAAGKQELSWDARGVLPGVYVARLTAGGAHATVRIVRVRR